MAADNDPTVALTASNNAAAKFISELCFII